MKLKYILALVMCLVVTPAKAELQIDVKGAMRDPLPLAFPEMIHERGYRRFGAFGAVPHYSRKQLYSGAYFGGRAAELCRLEGN